MTTNGLQYKGYTGSATFDWERRVARGRVQFIDDLVTYESPTVEGLEQEFRAAVDDYIETCKQLNRAPKKAFNGIFNVRTQPEKHQQLAALASARGISLNAVVNIAIDLVLSNPDREAKLDSAESKVPEFASQSRALAHTDMGTMKQYDDYIRAIAGAMTCGTNVVNPDLQVHHAEVLTIFECKTAVQAGRHALHAPIIGTAGASLTAYAVSGSHGKWFSKQEVAPDEDLSSSAAVVKQLVKGRSNKYAKKFSATSRGARSTALIPEVKH